MQKESLLFFSFPSGSKVKGRRSKLEVIEMRFLVDGHRRSGKPTVSVGSAQPHLDVALEGYCDGMAQRGFRLGL